MLSLWEQRSFTQYDIIIVGAGITGLSTAASLKEARPELDILVIERGTLPSGASTKNAGFACFGSISELAQDRLALGDEGMVALVNRRWQGLQKTIQRLGPDKIDLQIKGGYELMIDQTDGYLDQADDINQLLHPVFKKDVFELKNENIKSFGFEKTEQLVYNQFEGQLDTGKLMKSLWKYCTTLGIEILTGTEVLSINESKNGVEIETANIRFRARAVGVCTNAFTHKLIPDQLEIMPGRGMVMAVSTEKPLKFSGTFHYDEGYYYFRDFDGQLIFGGGRNLDFENETTTSFGINERIQQKLIADLKTIILPYTDFKIDMAWSGIMAFGPTKAPILKKVNNHIYVGVRLGGMGVALGSLLGEELAQMIIAERF